jgi:hypothetical protein
MREIVAIAAASSRIAGIATAAALSLPKPRWESDMPRFPHPQPMLAGLALVLCALALPQSAGMARAASIMTIREGRMA